MHLHGMRIRTVDFFIIYVTFCELFLLLSGSILQIGTRLLKGSTCTIGLMYVSRVCSLITFPSFDPQFQCSREKFHI